MEGSLQLTSWKDFWEQLQKTASMDSLSTSLHTDLKVGDKVQLVGTNKVGKCRFIGVVPFSDGVWVGLELADASGRNDGSVQGRRYFSCKPRHGLFVRLSSCGKVPSHSAANTPVRASSSEKVAQQVHANAAPSESISTADAMLERIQSILGSARKPAALGVRTLSATSGLPSAVASTSTSQNGNIVLPLKIESSAVTSTAVPPLPSADLLNANIPNSATAKEPAALLKEVLDSAVLQERIKKLVVAAVTTAISASNASPVPANGIDAASFAGLEGRVAALEKSIDGIKAGVENIQLLFASKSASATNTPSKIGKGKEVTHTPPRSKADIGTETDATSPSATGSTSESSEVQRLKEALEVVSQLTRDAQNSILAERAKRKEETEALLAQLAKVAKSPGGSPAR